MTIGTGKNIVRIENDLRGIVVNIGVDSLKVKFDDGKVVEAYEKRMPATLNINNLDLCYASTIHKAQGSQCNNVLVYLAKYNDSRTFVDNEGLNTNTFMNINMLYVALTRASMNMFVYSDIYTLTQILNTKNTDPIFIPHKVKPIKALRYKYVEEVPEEITSKLNKYNSETTIISNIHNNKKTTVDKSIRKKAMKSALNDLLDYIEQEEKEEEEQEEDVQENESELDSDDEMMEEEIF